MPSFNLPIDAVPFIARTSVGGDEKITARMSDGLEKALRGYAPGSELTYKKMDFVFQKLKELEKKRKSFLQLKMNHLTR